LRDNIIELRNCFQRLFNEETYSNSYIEITDNNEIVLSANREGLLLIIEEMITLCVNGQHSSHYHLDTAGMADKCDKPVIIQLINTPSLDAPPRPLKRGNR
jgi:hypothetical protein